MSIKKVGTIDFRVYDDHEEFVGIASVTLPDKNQKTITLSGASIGGDVEIPVRGHYDAMTLTLAFANFSERVARLREPRLHMLTLRIAQQGEDSVAGKIVVDADKHVFKCVPKSKTGGEVAPAQARNSNVQMSVRYWATFFNGRLVDEIDQLNRIDVVNGVDYNEPVRRALGL